jgi:hypothetical protein
MVCLSAEGGLCGLVAPYVLVAKPPGALCSLLRARGKFLPANPIGRAEPRRRIAVYKSPPSSGRLRCVQY